MEEKFIEDIANKISDGIIILNSNDKVIYANNYVRKALNIQSIDLEKVEISIGKDPEVSKIGIKAKGIDYDGIGELLEVDFDSYNYKNIIILNKICKKDKCNNIIKNNVWGEIKLESIIGESEAMQNIKRKIIKIANSTSSVLITGESGTGKEVIARAIHSQSNRRNKPFIAINCAAIPEALLESELFGYTKGAFSGASNSGRIGKFELANEGIIFLDEIGDMPLSLQVKLLRVLQERKFVKIGSNKMINLDIRVIAATNKDIKEMIKEKKFREDLYYRINVIPIEIPNLSERKEDIKQLVLNFIDKYCATYSLEKIYIEDDVIEKLKNYPWEGNIRELQNAVEFMINLVDEDNVITCSILPDNIVDYYNRHNETDLDKIVDGDFITLEELEKRYINYALEKYGHDTKGKSKAAKKLGIGLATLYRKS
ncbi:MAG: sigma 54-interacting transcriptional regulator [Clostridium sp.]|uniref:sigma-54 interaction domain-containing protein n=1 Tax=Clostridium sp. TaxID=1506 RepID=UPI001ECC4C25|nr:sigma 54-interacting transcriptional regulator [Clostridium sp.]MBS5883506.1 sigma 54-interacting transcriptional regulator [Clostridium sp.]MDU7147130.1 sigma 54-interacting transcriptional regulator [Clostridium sp.]MDU7240226.1 sigma 54-interacting transcriptional regulator [Clostridium sp.]